MRLGSWPTPLTAEDLTEEERRLLRVRMRWADALVVGSGTLIVVEAKMRPSEFLKGLGELLLYTHLVPHTPGLSNFKGWKVAGRLVITVADATVEYLARRQGFDVAVFQPSFWPEFLEAVSGRQTRPIRPEEASLLT
ncbi:MAG: hypothetical protein OEW93_01840 [Candidatus Bathyarchaeota archaeon]|nr:hypothetical protein [Candidatus Bathyarchaeota archaeon]